MAMMAMVDRWWSGDSAKGSANYSDMTSGVGYVPNGEQVCHLRFVFEWKAAMVNHSVFPFSINLRLHCNNRHHIGDEGFSDASGDPL